MVSKHEIPVRQMIHEAMAALGERATNGQVRDWVLAHYPGTNKGTIACTLTICTVNHASRVHYPENRRPRQADDTRYDYLFRPESGWVELYNPAQHGTWYITHDAQGRLAVSQQHDGANTMPVPRQGRGSITPTVLVVPITPAQVRAASDLFEQHLPQWVETEHVFEMLRHRLPDFSFDEVVVKIATVNHLFSTRVYALLPVARHFTQVMAQPIHDPVERVTALASVLGANGGEGTRMLSSLASKFAHFFINPEEFPILDSYNEKMLRYHLGRRGSASSDNRYAAFFENVRRFQSLGQLDAFTLRELVRNPTKMTA